MKGLVDRVVVGFSRSMGAGTAEEKRAQRQKEAEARAKAERASAMSEAQRAAVTQGTNERRNEQLAMRVSQSFKDRLAALKVRTGRSYPDLMEDALALFEAELNKRRDTNE